ncbi:MAG: hypothetical protein ABI166_12645 [Mucilaginibacter sp.]
MKTRFLFPHHWRIVGYVCLLSYIPFMIIKKLVYHGYMQNGVPIKIDHNADLFTMTHFFDVMPILIILMGLSFIAFAKEKIEDEQIAQLRLESLQWAVYLNYSLLILFVIFFSGKDEKLLLLLNNLWVPLIFFIVRFRWVNFRLNRLLKTN